MKKQITMLAAIFVIATLTSYATVRTVSNDPAGGAQYTNLQAAYTAAVNDDTLIFEGTNIPYGMSANWDKRLTVIGIGLNSQKQNPRRTIIGYFNPSGAYTFGANASGSKFFGIAFINTIDPQLTLAGNLTNMLFENCEINTPFKFQTFTAGNITFKNCVFSGNNTENFILSTSASASGILMSNCIFNGYINGSSNNTLSVTIDHCLFLSTSQVAIQNLKNAVLKNNIFMNNSTTQSGTSTNNQYLNNISRLGSIPTGFGSSGNLDNSNPNFVTYTVGQLYSTTHDYHLQGGSPAIGAANDGTDIGLHGGSSGFSESGEVLTVPIVRSVNISNTTAAPNGTLNVQINASKPSDN